jgi:threonine dehydratase
VNEPSLRPSREQIAAAARVVHAAMAPTPQQVWPLLSARLGAETWVKHENHTPVGAFKVRGGLVYFEELARSGRQPRGVICATRGNHGQSVAFAARRHGIPATIVVPHGNSREKNLAMRALGAQLVEHGEDFQEAREYAGVLAAEHGLEMVPSFHPLLVTGVATYALEFLSAAPALDVVYVPIGLGSGICGMLAARDALGLRTEIVGVVSAHATAYAESFAARAPVDSPATTKLADGMACRVVEPAALALMLAGVDRMVQVTDVEVADAMALLYECTHNVAEGAGAAAVAAATREAGRIAGRRVGVVLSGANVDRAVFARVLADARPAQRELSTGMKHADD